MNILISGSSGLIGSALTASLNDKGHNVLGLKRSKPAGNTPSWDPDGGHIQIENAADIDAVIHLAGDGIADGRWTASKKARILNSRVAGTTLIADYFASLAKKPKVFISASAIGYYGNRGDEIVDESSAAGDGFLADVCKQWEEATQKAKDAGIRVVRARIGVVLSPSGGALKKMLLPFKMGLGGNIGKGQQYMSWVSIDDAVGIFDFILANDSIEGPVNLVSPTPVINSDFTKALGKALNRPTLFPIPAFMVRLLFGEMGDECLLSSTRVMPEKILKSGYQFQHPTLENALEHLL